MSKYYALLLIRVILYLKIVDNGKANSLHARVQSVANYRCPRCASPHSVKADRIFDGRMMFSCVKCKECAVVTAAASTDEAYLEFLDKCDNNQVSTAGDLRLLMEQEKIVRPKKEIDSLLSAGGTNGDPLLEEVLRSERDYVVDFRAI